LFKPFYIFLFFTLFCCEAKTQTNLVYNGDFEIYDTCPPAQSGNSTTMNYLKHCTGWDMPTEGSSDYFNSCSTNNFSGIPKNYGGFQYPYNGNGYVGLYALIDFEPCQYREYIQTKLTNSLIKGKKYTIEYFVSNSFLQAAVNSISALFSNYKISSSTDCFIKANPQVNYTGGFITDTLNWTKISGSFYADGGEQYLTIGFFEDTLKHQGVLPLIPDSVSLGGYSIYYFVDGISVFESECLSNIPNVFTPNKDGINDLLKFDLCNSIEKTYIYNRWGINVFETTDANHYWDGRNTRGEECVDGNYYYIIETKEKIIKGFVQLIR
jgi:OOP family OmpA-OmpF porin